MWQGICRTEHFPKYSNGSSIRLVLFISAQTHTHLPANHKHLWHHFLCFVDNINKKCSGCFCEAIHIISVEQWCQWTSWSRMQFNAIDRRCVRRDFDWMQNINRQMHPVRKCTVKKRPPTKPYIASIFRIFHIEIKSVCTWTIPFSILVWNKFVAFFVFVCCFPSSSIASECVIKTASDEYNARALFALKTFLFFIRSDAEKFYFIFASSACLHE